MRRYWRQRNDLVQATGRQLQRTQKAMTQMKCAVVNTVKLACQSPAKHGLFDSPTPHFLQRRDGCQDPLASVFDRIAISDFQFSSGIFFSNPEDST